MVCDLTLPLYALIPLPAPPSAPFHRQSTPAPSLQEARVTHCEARQDDPPQMVSACCKPIHSDREQGPAWHTHSTGADGLPTRR